MQMDGIGALQQLCNGAQCNFVKSRKGALRVNAGLLGEELSRTIVRRNVCLFFT